MAFKIFTRKNEHINAEPEVLITRYGKFTFNVTATEKMRDKDIVKFTILFWDDETKIMGIRGVDSEDSAYPVYRLSPESRRKRFQISSIVFLRHIKIGEFYRLKLPVVWNEQEKLFTISFPEKYFF